MFSLSMDHDTHVMACPVADEDQMGVDFVCHSALFDGVVVSQRGVLTNR